MYERPDKTAIVKTSRGRSVLNRLLLEEWRHRHHFLLVSKEDHIPTSFCLNTLTKVIQWLYNPKALDLECVEYTHQSAMVLNLPQPLWELKREISEQLNF